MKKYIILFLFICSVSNAQYNLFARQNFNYKTVSTGTNTEIGGVASTISTPALLATKLGIDVSRITNFSIVGSDIQCRISGSYIVPSGCFYNDKNISYYNDIDNLVTKLNNDCFSLTDKILKIEFNGVTIIGKSIQFNSKVEKIVLPNCLSTEVDLYSIDQTLKILYIPKATNIGDTVGNDNYFIGQSSFLKIYANPTLQTINSGGVEGDLVGRNVRYVTNFTAPNTVTDLASGIIYNTAIQLNFTPPSSANAIEYYECYANGILKNTITGSGQYITGLATSTNYNITLKAVDIFYNKSAVSSISATTDNETWDISTGLVSYYKLDETSGTVANDSYGSNYLTNTGVSINQSGKVGTAYKTTSSIQKLQTTTATAITGNFTLNMWVYVPAAQTIYATPFEVGNYGTNTGFGFLFNSNNTISWRINQSYDHYNQSITYGVWQMITMVYNGTNVKFYVNGVLTSTVAHTTNPNTTQLRTAFYRQDEARQAVISLDEVSIHNIALTQNQIDILYNSGTGITL